MFGSIKRKRKENERKSGGKKKIKKNKSKFKINKLFVHISLNSFNLFPLLDIKFK